MRTVVRVRPTLASDLATSQQMDLNSSHLKVSGDELRIVRGEIGTDFK